MFFTAQTKPRTIISVAPKAQAQRKVNIENMTEAQAKRYILTVKKGEVKCLEKRFIMRF